MSQEIGEMLDRTSSSAGAHYNKLRDDILAGVFIAGSLLQETALASRYGVSRTPMREALARLEQDGLLERAPRGYRIRAGTPEDVLDIYDARIALESVAISSAAVRATDMELARLGFLHDDAAELSDPVAIRHSHSKWHRELWAAAHNPTVRTLLDRLTAQLRIYDEPGVEKNADLVTSQNEHAEIMKHLRRRDGQAAAAALTAHLQRSRDLRLRAFASL
jgi:DNA-binding GntR family transcriptional regulator